jgi:hypothetical protein
MTDAGANDLINAVAQGGHSLGGNADSMAEASSGAIRIDNWGGEDFPNNVSPDVQTQLMNSVMIAYPGISKCRSQCSWDESWKTTCNVATNGHEANDCSACFFCDSKIGYLGNCYGHCDGTNMHQCSDDALSCSGCSHCRAAGPTPTPAGNGGTEGCPGSEVSCPSCSS